MQDDEPMITSINHIVFGRTRGKYDRCLVETVLELESLELFFPQATKAFNRLVQLSSSFVVLIRHSKSKGSPNVTENGSCFTFECSCQTAKKKNTNTTGMKRRTFKKSRIVSAEETILLLPWYRIPRVPLRSPESESTPEDCCNDSSVIQVQMANSWMRSFN